jgi:uncharacterized surface protein with fasciclin (FAS1) repeats
VKRLFLKAAGAAAAGVLLKACGGGGGGGSSGGGGGGGGGGGNCQLPSGSDSLLQRLQQDSRFSALRQAVSKAGLDGTLDDRGANLTLFAPDNDAFDRLGSRIGVGDRTGLLAALSAGQWKDIINFALLPQRNSLCDLTPPSGQDLRPTTLFTQPTGEFEQLILVRDNGGPLTIWDGIGRFLITFQESDLGAANGVMHVPSDVLLPRYTLTVSQMLRASVDSFSDFAAVASDVPALNSPGSFTVFAPFNGTFTPPLTANQRRHHVVSGTTLKGDDFRTNPSLTPLFGGALTVRGGSPATVNAKAITDVDFFGSNGVIHVVDGVVP